MVCHYGNETNNALSTYECVHSLCGQKESAQAISFGQFSPSQGHSSILSLPLPSLTSLSYEHRLLTAS